MVTGYERDVAVCEGTPREARLCHDVVFLSRSKRCLTEKVLDASQVDWIMARPKARCSMAEAIVRWVREDMAAAALTLGAPLRGLDNYASYHCRGRNNHHDITCVIMDSNKPIDHQSIERSEERYLH